MLPRNIFNGLSSLKTLSLRSSGLTTLNADLFRDLTALESLDLSGNQISSLPDGIFKSLTRLTSLDISSNKLPYDLPRTIFSELVNVYNFRHVNSSSLNLLPRKTPVPPLTAQPKPAPTKTACWESIKVGCAFYWNYIPNPYSNGLISSAANCMNPDLVPSASKVILNGPFNDKRAAPLKSAPADFFRNAPDVETV